MSKKAYLIVLVDMTNVKGVEDLESDYISTWYVDNYTIALDKVRSELWKIYIVSGGDPNNGEYINKQLDIIKEKNEIKVGDVYIEIRYI